MKLRKFLAAALCAATLAGLAASVFLAMQYA